MAQATAERNSWLTETFGAGTAASPVHVDIDNITPGRSEVEVLQLLTSFHSLYFFMSGIDNNAQIQTGDGTMAHIHDGDDHLYFVGITSATSIESIQWRAYDGLELFGFGTPQAPAPAPEAATWLYLATGLLAFTRRCKDPSVPWRGAPWTWRSARLARLLRATLGPHNPPRPGSPGSASAKAPG